MIVAEFYRKILKESWVVLVPVLLSFLITIFSGVHQDMFGAVLYFWGFFFLMVMICFRLSYKRFYQKIFEDFKWVNFIAFVAVFGLLWFGFWLFVLKVFIA